MIPWWYGAGLDAAGLVPLLLLRARRRTGWLAYVCVMVLWMVYSVATAQWGFLPGAGVYALLYGHNWHHWKYHLDPDGR